ncbi:MAG: hypothetical protein ACUVR0_07945 [Candidatus Aminicenantales bacterium]
MGRQSSPLVWASTTRCKISAAQRYQLVSFASEITVANDNTVRLGGLIINLPPDHRCRSYARRRVLVRQHLDKAWTVWLEGHCIGRHGPTSLREPFRSRQPHQRGETRSTHHILQVYHQTAPTPNPGGHFSLAVEGSS